MHNYTIVNLRQMPEWKETAAHWFHTKWGVPLDAYQESMDAALQGGPVPAWYLCLDGETIVGGMGVIENDFHDRPDLTPNVCAVFTEPAYRCQGIAGRLLDRICKDMKAQGIDTLYLVTDHTSFYERYGWQYLCPVHGDEGDITRMYIHKQEV